MSAHLLVVGGGITGLAAAWEAQRRGARVTLVEARDRVGGKVATEVAPTPAGDFLVELGPDAFLASKPALVTLIEEAGLAGEMVSMAAGRSVLLRRRGRLLPIPDSMGMVLPTRIVPFALTRTLSLLAKARAGLDLVLPRRLTDEDVTVGHFLRSRLGRGVVEGYADPLVGGIYGASVDDLSLDAALPMLRDSERRYRSLVLASLAAGRAARRSGAAARGMGSPMRTLARGLGSLTETLAERLRAGGADLRLSTAASSLTVAPDGGVMATLADGSTVAADAVVLATGARALGDLLAPVAPDAAAALHGIPETSTVSVSLGYAERDLPTSIGAHGWLECEPAAASGASVLSAKWPGRAPAGHVLIRVLMPEKVGPVAELTEDELVTRARDYLGEVLGITAEPVLARAARWIAMMPLYAVGHLDRVVTAERGVAALSPRWALAGAALRGVGLPDCVSFGRAAAATVLEGLLDGSRLRG